MLSNMYNVLSVTVNTGNVSYTLNGNTINITVSNGSHVDYSSGSYTPSKSASLSQTSPSSSFNSTMYYSDGSGYTGTLYASGSPYVISGSAGYSDSKTVESNGYCQIIYTYVWNGSRWVYDSKTHSPLSSPYNVDGYSGTQYFVFYSGESPNPPSGSGSYVGATTSRNANGSGLYRGTVTKSIPDTRTWRQDYSGTVYGSTEYYSTYYYAYSVSINYADFPLINNVKFNNNSVVNNGTLSLSSLSDVALSFSASDQDSGNILSYSVLIRGVQKIAYTDFTKGTTVNLTISSKDLITGNNSITIKVKDVNGAESTFNYVIRNKYPQTLSLRTVKELEQSLGYAVLEYDDLRDIKPTGYNGKLSFSEIINYLS